MPILLVSFIGGALADAVDRRKMVRITQLSACGVVAVLVVNSALPRPQLWVLFAVVIAAAGVDALERPSLDALVPRIVSRDQLTAAAALESLRGNLGQVLGPPVAGVLIATVGLPATYGVDVASFLVATVALALMRAVPPAPDASGVNLRAALAGQENCGVEKQHRVDPNENQGDVLWHADDGPAAECLGARRTG